MTLFDDHEEYRMLWAHNLYKTTKLNINFDARLRIYTKNTTLSIIQYCILSKKY